MKPDYSIPICVRCGVPVDEDQQLCDLCFARDQYVYPDRDPYYTDEGAIEDCLMAAEECDNE